MYSSESLDSEKIYESVFEESLVIFRKSKESSTKFRSSMHRCWELFDISDTEQRIYSRFLSTYDRDIHYYFCKVIYYLFNRYGMNVLWLYDVNATRADNVKTIKTKFIYEDNGVRTGYAVEHSLTDLEIINEINAHHLDNYVLILLRDKAESDYYREKHMNPLRTNVSRAKFEYLEDFWIGFFGQDEFRVFSRKLNEYQTALKQIIGYQTTPFLTATNFSALKTEIKKEIINIDLSEWSYKLIDHTNQAIKGYRYLETYSFCEDDRINLYRNFIDKGTYKGLLGKSDYSRSFVTSEWLYYSLRGSVNIDYTAIVCGYLKSLEQILQSLVGFLVDKKYRDKNYYFTLKRDKIKEYKKSTGQSPIRIWKYSYIPLTSDNLKWMDFSMANLIAFMQNNNGLFMLKKDSHRVMCDMLSCFRIECRNGYFHKENIYDWRIVEATRNNIYLLYYLIFGSFRFSSGDDLGIVEPDEFDKLCVNFHEYWRKYRYFLLLKDNKWILTIYDNNNNPPLYDNRGNPSYSKLVFIRVRDYSYDALLELDEYPELQEFVVVTREDMPERIVGRRNEDDPCVDLI